MGYILLSPKYIEFIGEDEDKKWHLFETETLEKDNNILDSDDDLGFDDLDYDDILEDCDIQMENTEEIDCITIEDRNIKISKNPRCENSEIFSNTTG